MQLGRFTIENLEIRRLLATVPAGFIDQAYGASISSGSAMEFAPDGRLFVLTQPGTVRVIDQSGNLLPTPAATITVDSFFERGLLGIAFDPSFNAAQPGADYVYLYYTLPSSAGGPINQISRFEVNGNTIDLGTRQEIFRFNTLSAGNHNGGAIHFGPDGMLYAAHGDNAVSSNAQTISNLLGKIVRIDPSAYVPGNPLSVIPADNPTSIAGIAGTTSGINRAIWAAGLRNPYTFAFHPTNGSMYINDVGQSSWEEINNGVAGRNYGWPNTEGDFNQASFPNFTRPVYAYARGSAAPRGAAISGGAFYQSTAPNQFPANYQNRYFFGDYVADWISTIDPATPPAVTTAPGFASGALGIVDIKLGADGAIYYLQRETTAGVRRVRPDPTQAPSVIDQPDNASVFDGQAATFEVVAGGAGTLSYQWTRNGVDIPGANGPMYVLSSAQASDNGAVFRVRVSNAIGIALSNPATLTVTVNAAPQLTINTPTTGALYTAGDTINFSGGGTDFEDGDLRPAQLEWQVDFHHDTHTHPFFPPTSGITSGQFTIPQTGETAANVFYRVYLRGTDSGGRTSETYVDILPRTAELTVTTNVPGLTINVDGQPQITPNAFLGVAGIIRNLDAPLNQVVAGQTYIFQNWSDSGAANHDITTPLLNTTYTANYNDITNPLVNGGAFAFDDLAPLPPHRAQLIFSENVSASLAVADVTITRRDDNSVIPAASIALAYDSVTNTASFSFPGLSGGVLPDGNYRISIPAGSVTDSFGNALASPFQHDFFVFQGDANHDRIVNISDFAALAANFNETGTRFSEGDFDYNGTTNINDFSVLASRFNQSLPDVLQRTASERVSSGSRVKRNIFADSPIVPAWKSVEESTGDDVL